MTKERKKCLVRGCTNHTDEGGFVGELCVPCYHLVTQHDIKREAKSHAALVEALEGFLDLSQGSYEHWLLWALANHRDKARAALTLAKGA